MKKSKYTLEIKIKAFFICVHWINKRLSLFLGCCNKNKSHKLLYIHGLVSSDVKWYYFWSVLSSDHVILPWRGDQASVSDRDLYTSTFIPSLISHSVFKTKCFTQKSKRSKKLPIRVTSAQKWSKSTAVITQKRKKKKEKKILAAPTVDRSNRMNRI